MYAFPYWKYAAYIFKFNFELIQNLYEIIGNDFILC